MRIVLTNDRSGKKNQVKKAYELRVEPNHSNHGRTSSADCHAYISIEKQTLNTKFIQTYTHLRKLINYLKEMPVKCRDAMYKPLSSRMELRPNQATDKNNFKSMLFLQYSRSHNTKSQNKKESSGNLMAKKEVQSDWVRERAVEQHKIVVE